MTIFEIIICIVSGILAGVGTGFAGLSAAVFISPMLVFFLGVDIYEAVCIALASDVLASAVSSITYAKNKNIEIKKSRTLFIGVLVFAIIGSVIAFFISSTKTGNGILSYWSVLGSIMLGFKFLFDKDDKPQKEIKKNKALIIPIAALIGFICGFQGAGGGLMLLFALTILLSYDYKKAVGTSVFIMTFTALIGSVSHTLMYGMPNIKMLIICSISALIGARASAKIANKVNVSTLRKIVAILLIVSGATMLIYAYIQKS